MIRIFVGSDMRQGPAERALENSIRQNTDAEVQFTFMRSGTPGFRWRDDAWKTKFSCFRLAVPELCQFQGKAIYMDSDMIVLGDIQELFDLPQKAPWLCMSEKRSEPAVIDCEAFADVAEWPTIKDMARSTQSLWHYRQYMIAKGLFDCSLPVKWNCIDGVGFCNRTKLLHFSTLETQPWRPWPEDIEYRDHPRPELVDLWRSYAGEAVGS